MMLAMRPRAPQHYNLLPKVPDNLQRRSVLWYVDINGSKRTVWQILEAAGFGQTRRRIADIEQSQLQAWAAICG